MLEHFFCVSVGDQERDVVSLLLLAGRIHQSSTDADLDCFPPQDKEGLRSLGKKASELVNQYVLDLVCLLYSYADSYAVDTRLYEDLLVLITSDCEWIQQNLW